MNGKFKENMKKLVKIKEHIIDGPIFNVHCKMTAVLLFLASTIVSTKSQVGKPMECISDMKKDAHKVVETFCWINSTYRMVPKVADDRPMTHQISSPYAPSYSASDEEVYYPYYQWVGFILFLQAILFYAPKFFWKQSEGKLMERLLGTEARKLVGGDERRKKCEILTNYLMERLKGHGRYAITYWLFECLCLCNVLLQMIAIDKFLGGNGQFLSYGFKFSFYNTYDVDTIFPLQTRCAFYKYGPGGTVQYYDVLCVLYLNMINRYIFAAMWYWFLLLILLLVILLSHRMLLILSPWLRCWHLKIAGRNNLQNETNFIVCKLPVTDFWAVYMLKGNLDAVLFEGVILALYYKLLRAQKDQLDE